MSAPRSPQIRVQLTEHGRLVLILCVIVGALGVSVGAAAGTQRILYPSVLLLFGTRYLGLRNVRGVQAQMPGPLTDFEFQSTETELRLQRLTPGVTHDLLVHHGDGVVRRPVLYVASLRLGEDLKELISMRMPGRGRQQHHTLSLRSTWPLGLFQFEAVHELQTEVLSLPRLGELRNADALMPVLGHRRALDPVHPGEASEFYALREWRPGMSQRAIHWKATARANKLMLRETRSQRKPSVHILLAPPPVTIGRTRGSESAQRRRRLRAWEDSIRLTATVVEHFLRNDYSVTLRCHGEGAFRLRVPPGRQGLFRSLGLLAPLPRDPAPRNRSSLAPARGDIGIVIQAGGGHELSPGHCRLDPYSPDCAQLFRKHRRVTPRTRMEATA